MSFSVTMPALGESVYRGHGHALAEEGGRRGSGRRAAARGVHRQGRHRDPLPRRRHRAEDRGRRGRDRAGRRRARGDRRRCRRGRSRSRPRAERGGSEQAGRRAGRRGRGGARREAEQKPGRAEQPAAQEEPAAQEKPATSSGRRGRRWHAGHHARARRERVRGHRHPLAQAGRRRGGRRRAAARGVHGQGGHRDPLPRGGHAALDRGERGRDRPGGRRARDDRRRVRRRQLAAGPEGARARQPDRGRGRRARARARVRPPASGGRPSPLRPYPHRLPRRPSRRQARLRTGTGGAAPAASADGSGAPGRAMPRAYVTPLVRKLAGEHGVDLARVSGTGVGGRIRKQDVLAAAESAKAAPPAPSRPRRRSKAAARPRRPARGDDGVRVGGARYDGEDVRACARSSPRAWSSRCRSRRS